MTTVAIAVQDLRKRYGAHEAVAGLSLQVAPGEVFGLLGPNGAGKTTTVECLLGLRLPDSGHVRVLDLPPGHPQLKVRLGVQLQSTGLFPRLTVRELLRLYAALYARHLPLDEVLARVGLQDRVHARCGELSGGQRQRLALAIALLNDPELLFLDEPTAAMDPQARRHVWDLITELRANGRTVLLTTHYMEEAAQLCDRVAILDHGRIIAEGSPDALVRAHLDEAALEFAQPAGTRPETFQALTGVTRVVEAEGQLHLYSRNVPETVSHLMEQSRLDGFRLEGFSVRHPSLDDLFLHLTGRKIRS